ncbi:EAL domain-containing protein [Microbacterium sp. LWH12-1.2]|uniref:EAL domain-containing protein n=1 Tax=Microbacterium sp. LWH12-1.2 TaxID=3135259 RepID=UPI00343695E7
MPNHASLDAEGATTRMTIVFQPIVDLHLWRVVGFEALARFADGAPPPAHLARAEAAGSREELELDLIRNAVSAAVALPSDAFVTLNASGSTILRPEMAEILEPCARPWGLEIYEGATTASLAAVRERVTGLGGQLLVDDAGAASADEARITTLRPEVVKIDRTLFWQVAADDTARGVLEGLLAAARESGAKILVEGVSDDAEVERARALGSDLAQGFHLGVPTPAEGVPEMLAELHRRVGVDAPGL